jgi:hypothetical protein
VAVAALALGVFTVIGTVIGGVFWLVTLPFRILFKLLGGLLFAPVLMLVAGVAILVAFVAALAALLAPLVPLMLFGLIGWGIYRWSRRGSVASF